MESTNRQNPFTSPDLRLPRPPVTPGVVTWFKIYAAFMAFIYALAIVGGILLLVFGPGLADEENPAEFFLIQGIVFVAISVPLGGMFVIGIFMPAKRWAWVYGIVLIGLGMTSCCFLPATIPLLIFWLKPETQTYFGRVKEK